MTPEQLRVRTHIEPGLAGSMRHEFRAEGAYTYAYIGTGTQILGVCNEVMDDGLWDFGAVLEDAARRNARAAYLQMIEVERHHQGTGLGSALLRLILYYLDVMQRVEVTFMHAIGLEGGAFRDVAAWYARYGFVYPTVPATGDELSDEGVAMYRVRPTARRQRSVKGRGPLGGALYL